MKKIFYIILSFGLLVITGCTNVPIKTELLTPNDKVKIEVFHEGEDVFRQGIGLSIENLTNEVLEIDWNSSSLDGDSIIISGQLYSQINTLLPKTVVAPHSKATKSINKVTNIDNFWIENGEKEVILPAKLVLHITIKGKSEYIILNLVEKIKK